MKKSPIFFLGQQNEVTGGFLSGISFMGEPGLNPTAGHQNKHLPRICWKPEIPKLPKKLPLFFRVFSSPSFFPECTIFLVILRIYYGMGHAEKKLLGSSRKKSSHDFTGS